MHFVYVMSEKVTWSGSEPKCSSELFSLGEEIGGLHPVVEAGRRRVGAETCVVDKNRPDPKGQTLLGRLLLGRSAAGDQGPGLLRYLRAPRTAADHRGT